MSIFKVDIVGASHEQAKKLEYEVFLRSGYIDANEQSEVIENHKYSDSRFVVVYDEETGKVAGSVRLVLESEKSINELEIAALHSFKVWPWMRRHIRRLNNRRLLQVGSMVIHESARGGKVLGLLIKKMIEVSWREGIRYGVSSIDERFYKVLVKKGYPIRQIGDKKYYMGSVTVPVMFDAYELPVDMVNVAQLDMAS
jgi:N-acyl-L-homoserine lactone synthetase